MLRQIATLAVALLLSVAASGQHGARDGEWPVTGGDKGATKYSPLDQIDPGNVSKLEIVWEWVSADAPILGQHPSMGATNFETTPLLIDGVLYGTTSLSQLFALDPATGKTLWVFDPKGYDTDQVGRGLTFLNRGAAYWSGNAETPPRLFVGSQDARLVAIDPVTGEPVGGFGENGEIDTKVGIPRLTNRRQYGLSSAPIVCGDVVIVGSRVSDGALRKSAPPGYVRGYSAKTGEELWAFHSVPLEGEPGNETWENDSWRYSGGTNVWSLLSADEEAGLVYLPFTTPTNDFYGGDRLGDNLYAESLVSLECKTGKKAWHFQVVHHGLWDYDLPTPPVLADITVNGRDIKAAVQLTKHGFAFVFDRITGEPVWPIEERPVPQSDVPGERTSPTQPFPTRPPPFERQGITVDDLIDWTPELRAEAEKILEGYRYGPLFTPPALEPTLLLPSYGGGANWPGGSLDPESGILYVPSMTRVLVLNLTEPDPSRSDFAYVNRSGKIEGPQGLPIIKPPYGRVTAIDLNAGEILWTIANGGDGPRDHPAIEHLDLPPLGTPTRAAVLVTRTLLFVTEGSGRSGSAIGGGNAMRAIDKRTGEELWRIDLGAQVTGIPMTYLSAGRQFVVAAVGSEPPRLVAFALPEKKPAE